MVCSSQQYDDTTGWNVRRRAGLTMTVMAFNVTGGKITHIWAVRNPGKLRPWTTG